MTRNTKLYQLKTSPTVVYRDLTINELDFLSSVKKEVLRYELAAKVAIVEPTDTTGIPIGTLIQVGHNAIVNSSKTKNDSTLFELSVKEYREKLEVESATPYPLIIEIIKTLPGQSITDLLNLTYNDIIELACVCEKIKGSQILSPGKLHQKKKGRLVDAKNLPDDGKSLQEKMDELNLALGQRNGFRPQR